MNADGQAGIAFAAFLMVFLAIGVASMRRSLGTTGDYFLASRSVHPALVGLSAMATNNSGYMFIGVIGYTYATGLASIWLMFGWIAGDLVASLLVHRHLRIATGRSGALTFAGALANWGGQPQRAVRIAASLLTITFLGAYAAAQFAAGSKALTALFGWSPASGACLVAAVVALYCLAGGIRASIWTDAVQTVVMLVAMTVLFVAAVAGLGGPAASWQAMAAVPHFLDWFPRDLWIPGVAGMALFVVGWMFAGLSVAGQPHIMVRFMALDRVEHLWVARCWYYVLFTLFYALATGVGMLSRIHLPELASLDPEMALPTMAQRLLAPPVVGLILAGIFAATMSTADSLVLACSASLTHDLPAQPNRSIRMSKLATLGVTAVALGFAVSGSRSVFDVVILAWSTLASAFVPLLYVLVRGHRPAAGTALAMMAAGVAIALLWRALGLHDHVYEGLPGILGGLAVHAVACQWTGRRALGAIGRPGGQATPRVR